ncbi:Sec20 domain containing protein [Diplocarpon rosae]|nr:Sec20 domain containing protein [Diplocarpon rosae]
MSFQIISERLKNLQESTAQLKEFIERLANINFQPGSVPLSIDEDDNILREMVSEIHQTIREQDEEFEILQEEVEELVEGKKGSEMEHQKIELRSAVVRGIRELKKCQSAFRRAQVAAKRSLDAAQRAERDLLLQSYLEPRSSTSSPIPGQRRQTHQNIEMSKEEKTINASSDVTTALRRTHDMMAAELSRSQFAHETLRESTAALAQLSETYSSLDTLLSSSKNLLGTLLRSQKSDTWYLETAFYVLLATIVWLVWRRLLYGPTWWLFYFPLKMFLKGCMGVFAAMGLLGGDVSVSPSFSSVMSQATAVHSSGTRDPKPTWKAPQAQEIRVGGGGRGAPMQSIHQSGHSMTEQVEKMVDEAQTQDIGNEGTVEAAIQDGIQNQPEDQLNPKKRMWEEDQEAAWQGKEDVQGHAEL